MRTNTLSGGIYTFIAWFPMFAIIACVAWVLAVGVMHLETNSYGTEFFVKNSETTNQLTPLPGSASSNADMAELMAADLS